jgi:hypothetical protein
MWVEVKTAPNLIIAEMWKEFFEGEGIPTRLLVHPDSKTVGEGAMYRVLIPKEKDHVVQEILRKV